MDFQGHRMWYRHKPESIFVVVRPSNVPHLSSGRYIADLYIRRPGMTRGPIARLGADCHPAGQP